MKKLTTLFLLLFLAAGINYAQEKTQIVRGKVIDTDSKFPLESVSIAIFDTAYINGTETDKDGNFIIEKIPLGRINIKVSLIGYYNTFIPEIVVSSGKEVFVNIELKESIITTEEIEVTADMEKDKPVNSMALISSKSFTVEETRRYAGSFDDPLRAVQSFAGVVSSPNLNTNGIIIRGNSPKGLLWRLEDIDIPNPNHFSYAGQSSGGLTIFSSQLLTKSDFYTSAFPPEFGNALSGVFDMRFRNGNPFRREFTIQAGIQGIDISAEGPFVKGKSSSYLFNYRYSIFSFLQLIDKEMENKIPSYQDLSFKLNIPTGDIGTLTLFGIGGISKSKFDPEQDSTKWEDLEDRKKSTLNNKMGAFGLSYGLLSGKNTLWKSTISGSYNEVFFEEGLINTSYRYEPSDEVNYKTSRLSVSTALNHKFSTVHTNKTGITYSKLFFDADISSQQENTGIFMQFADDEGNTNLLQAYTQSKFDFFYRLSITAGLNYSLFRFNNNYSVDPRFAVRWLLTDKQAISLGYGKHSQLEDISVYLSENNYGSGVVYNPNKELDFSRAHHFVLGYDIAFRNDLRMKIETYYQYLYDIPVMRNSYYSMLNNPGGYFNDSLINEGTGRNFGIDITFEKYMTDNFYYLVTASLFDSKYKGGDGIERNGRYNGNYVFNILFGKEFETENKNVWGINLKINYTGGQYYIPVDLESSIAADREILDYGKIYTKRLNSFLYLDFSLTYRMNYSKASGIFTLQVKNLLNQKPAIGYEYNAVLQQVEARTELGITPMFSYRLEF
ncbi:MAG: TonB-dependent receptor [Ignavibacteria bacterium]|nr:TonB-dependent receptor [Ignavibacteria bacterium]